MLYYDFPTKRFIADMTADDWAWWFDELIRSGSLEFREVGAELVPAIGGTDFFLSPDYGPEMVRPVEVEQQSFISPVSPIGPEFRRERFQRRVFMFKLRGVEPRSRVAFPIYFHESLEPRR